MQTHQWKNTDKSSWPRGQWDNEPDKKQWEDPATGLACLIHRNHGGAWCGYVGVPESHPLHGKGYDDIDVSCHGGLTFAAECGQHALPEKGICHLREPGDPEVWWFGFDCSHSGDVCPSYGLKHDSILFTDGIYRTQAYVEEEVTSLAKQLGALSNA